MGIVHFEVKRANGCLRTICHRATYRSLLIGHKIFLWPIRAHLINFSGTRSVRVCPQGLFSDPFPFPLPLQPLGFRGWEYTPYVWCFFMFFMYDHFLCHFLISFALVFESSCSTRELVITRVHSCSYSCGVSDDIYIKSFSNLTLLRHKFSIWLSRCSIRSCRLKTK